MDDPRRWGLVLPGDQLQGRGVDWGTGEHWGQTDSGLIVPTANCEVAEMSQKPVGVGLFCGAGGMDLGMTSAGFHMAVASDDDLYASCTYLCNLGGPDTVIVLLDDLVVRKRRKDKKTNPDWDDGYVPGQYHAGEAYACREMFPAAGSGWISSARDHEFAGPDCRGHREPGEEGYEDWDEERLDDHNRWFCETYCGGGLDVDAEPCEVFFYGDVTKLKGSEILAALDRDEVDVVVGGPPCQGFSKANSKTEAEKRHDPRNLLVFEFVRLVLECHAKSMVMENVPQITKMLTAEGVPIIDALTRILEDGGFGGYDALRKSLLASAGVDAGAVIRGKPAKAKPEKPSIAETLF
jgi:DNA (cytosine-5)-methyltransferase 1